MRRLNLGCGSIYRKGYVNVDAHDRTVADLLCDASALPFRERVFDAIEGTHVLEHLGYIRAIQALSECYRVGRRGAALVLETPDIEESFRAFLDSASDRERAALLSWIFGLDSPGQLHRILFPSRLLRRMLRETGFKGIRIGSPRTHLYREGLRATALRSSGTRFGIIAEVRRRVYGEGIVDPGDHLQALEFERKFVRRIRRFYQRGGRHHLGIYKNLVYSPRAVVVWLDAAERGGRGSFERFAEYRRLAKVLEDLGFASRLMQAFGRHLENPDRGGDAYRIMSSRAVRLLTDLVDRPSKDIAQRVQAAYPDRWRGDLRVFSRTMVEAEVRGMRDRAIKYMIQGRFRSAARLLRLAINSGIDTFFSLVNYAVLNASVRRYKEAANLYKVALISKPGDEMELLLRQEIVVCLLSADQAQAAIQAAQKIGEKQLRSFWLGVILYHGGSKTRCKATMARLQSAGFVHPLFPAYVKGAWDEEARVPLPSARVEPFMTGEGVFHKFKG
jgi:predicted SAM-dependent methyltransferase/tetratricopeptide (TPR) repeat protein